MNATLAWKAAGTVTENAVAASGGLASRWNGRASKIAGVLIPLALLSWVASNQVLSSDGGINLQLSQSVASGHGFASTYDHTISPPRVQTSGYFVLLGALFIKLFGTSAFVLQLTNIVFLGLLLAATSYVLRPWPALQIVGPLGLVLVTPGITSFGLGGLGEFAVSFCMVAAFGLLSLVIEGARRPLRLCCLASALIGVSLTIKMVTIAELPVLVLGLLLVALSRRDVRRSAAAASTLTGLIPVIGFEAYRAAQFGSASGWLRYWSNQLHATGTEAAGPDSARASVSTPTGLTRFASLGEQVGVHIAALIIVWLVLPIVLLAISYRRRPGTRGQWLAEPRRTLEVLLAGVIVLYIPWYLFVSPLDWLRHFEVAVTAVSVMYLLQCGRQWDALRVRRASQPPYKQGARTRLRRSLAIAATGSTLICLVRFAAANSQALVAPDRSTLNAETAVSEYVANMSRDGATICGSGIMSSPMVSLTADVPLCDLETADPCAANLHTSFTAGTLFLIWDGRSTLQHPVRPPTTERYSFARIAEPSSFASIWRVSLRAGVCD